MTEGISAKFEELVSKVNNLASYLQQVSLVSGDIPHAVAAAAVKRHFLLEHLELADQNDKGMVRELCSELVKTDKRVMDSTTNLSNTLFDYHIDLHKISGLLTTVSGEQQGLTADLLQELAALRARTVEHAPHKPAVREAVWDMTGGRCFHCDAELVRDTSVPHDGSKAFHVDHLVPKAAGGPDHLSNYVPACQACNVSKGDKSYVEFRAVRAQVTARQLTVIRGGA